MSVKSYYRQYRDKGWTASMAYYAAKTRVQWDDLEYDEIVRIRVEPDDGICFEDLCGDCFDHDVNDNITPERLDRGKQEFLDQCNRDGIWYMVGEYFNGVEWVHADSIGGLVGYDSLENDCCYTPDIMASVIEAYANQQYCVACKQPVAS